MENYYMIITTKQDYMKDVENKFKCAGFPNRNRDAVAKMQENDKIIYYVSKVSMFCAAVNVVGPYYVSQKQIWTDPFDLWEHRIKTTPLISKPSYKEGIFIKDIWDDLEMIKNKNKWGSQVMGSFRRLSEHDYKIIFNALKESEK